MTSPVLEMESTTRVLVISPHFDDAVLSAWALLSLPNCPTDVLTVCGGVPVPTVTTKADRACGFIDSEEAVSARRREDENALSVVASWHGWLPLVDSQYLHAPRDESDAQVLVQAVMAWVDEYGSPDAELAIAVPAGAGIRAPHASSRRPSGRPPRGGAAFAWLRALKHQFAVRRRRRVLGDMAPVHPDHLFVRDTVLNTRERFGSISVLLYEELPYLWSSKADGEVAALGEHEHFSADSFEIDIDQRLKQQALSNYASQLTSIDPSGRLHEATLLPPSERYWRVRPHGEHKAWS
ncbi:hypothetical protein [Microbacterium sp. MMO-10]|uniref:hypothetical protein n=1 Tax=Microbacterium sp. MMO-10 TaxID=3081272 RepID=UPI0030167C4F